MKRTKKYHKDIDVEMMSSLINVKLATMEDDLLDTVDGVEPKHPVVFIVGAPRSGSTLLHQMLASTGSLGYISNFVARFWRAPYFASIVEDIMNIRQDKTIPFSSDYGRTSELHHPHDFAYFWRRFLRYNEDHEMNPTGVNEDMFYLTKEVRALESMYKKPMMFKNLFCGFQIPYLKACLPTAKFIVCVRSIVYQMQSILLARKSYFGSYDGWFSVKPPEYKHLKETTPYEQVSGQIFYTMQAIREGIKTLNEGDKIVVEYEDFTSKPKEVTAKIFKKFNINGDVTMIPEVFEHRNKKRVSQEEWGKITEVIWGLWM